jgi:hypothetical protein
MKEAARALQAFSDYLAQPPPRSLERLAQGDQSASTVHPPTRRLQTLKNWSRSHERMLAEEDARENVQKRKQTREARLGIAAQVMSTY